MPPPPLLCFLSTARPLPSTTTPFILLSVSLSASALSPPLSSEKQGFSTATSRTGMAGLQEKASQPPPGSVSERIMPHLLNLYGSCATARDFEIYAPHATFEDPLMRAHGVKQIKSAFYSLPKVFSESKIVEYTIQENETGPGKVEILIDNKQHYKVLGKAVDLTTLITLNVEDGKVVKHQDWWDKKPLKNRETVSFPLVGRLAEGCRRGAMLLTHVLMGCGKDPTP